MSSEKHDHLCCNHCWVPLQGSSAVLTTCSHLYCLKCARAWFRDHSECSVCSKTIDTTFELDEISLQLNPKLSRALYGQKPSKIIEIANGAIKFWDYHSKMLLSWKEYCSENENSKRKDLERIIQEQEHRISELSDNSSRLEALEKDNEYVKQAFERSEKALDESERRCKKLEELYGEVAQQLNGLLLPPDLAHIRTVLNTFNTKDASSSRSSRSHTPRIHVYSQNTRNSFLPPASSNILNRGVGQPYDNRFEDQQLVSTKRKLPSMPSYRHETQSRVSLDELEAQSFSNYKPLRRHTDENAMLSDARGFDVNKRNRFNDHSTQNYTSHEGVSRAEIDAVSVSSQKSGSFPEVEPKRSTFTALSSLKSQTPSFQPSGPMSRIGIYSNSSTQNIASLPNNKPLLGFPSTPHFGRTSTGMSLEGYQRGNFFNSRKSVPQTPVLQSQSANNVGVLQSNTNQSRGESNSSRF